jgi:hypothetical protein
MKKICQVLLMLFTMICFSCKEEEQPNFVVVDMMTFITVLDQQGNNLLDPSNEGSFMEKEIKIFYERNGKMEEFFQANLDMPRNFRIDPPELGSDYLIALALEAETTVIQWNEVESDTLRAEIEHLGQEGTGIVVKKVFYMDEIKYNIATSTTGREFTIIK